jgi:hypothetical protein
MATHRRWGLPGPLDDGIFSGLDTRLPRRRGMALAGRDPWLAPAEQLLDESGCIIAGYSKKVAGFAFTNSHDWAIVVPAVSSPMRFAIFAHEVGHQQLHRRNGKYPRWREEAEAWEYAGEMFVRFDLELPDDVVDRADRSIDYALGKAIRRGADPTFPGLHERWRHLLEPTRWTHVAAASAVRGEQLARAATTTPPPPRKGTP